MKENKNKLLNLILTALTVVLIVLPSEIIYSVSDNKSIWFKVILYIIFFVVVMIIAIIIGTLVKRGKK